MFVHHQIIHSVFKILIKIVSSKQLVLFTYVFTSSVSDFILLFSDTSEYTNKSHRQFIYEPAPGRCGRLPRVSAPLSFL